MMRIRITMVFFSLLIAPLVLRGQAKSSEGQSPNQIAVFVCKSSGVTTPLAALRAELTRSLVNGIEGAYVVLDRTDEILEKLKETYKYQGSGFVRDDQIADIGNQLGEELLYVVNVTYYEEYDQYFFEGKFIEVETTTTPKSAIYPDPEKNQAPVKSLSPQDQIKVGRELAIELKLLSDEEIDARRLKAEKEDEERNAAVRRAQNRKRVSNVFEDLHSFGMTMGSGGNGFQINYIRNIKYIHLGFGTVLNLNSRSFPLGNVDGFYNERYELSAIGIHFSAGVNFKYVGFAICPELLFLSSENYSSSREKEYKTVSERFSNPLVGLTPTMFLNIPFSREGGWGLIGSVGYTFLPEIKYNSGFQFTLGFAGYW